MTRSDAVLSRLVARRPKLGNALGVTFHAAGACLALAVMLRAWPKWLDALDGNYYVGTIGVFTFPEWPLILVIFIGCGLVFLQFAMLAAGDLLSLCGVPPAGPGGRR